MYAVDRLNRTLGPPLLGGAAADLTGLATNHRLHGFSPVNTVDGVAGYQHELLDRLRTAFPKGEERTDIRLAGQFKGGEWVAASGHIAGLASCMPPTDSTSCRVRRL